LHKKNNLFIYCNIIYNLIKQLSELQKLVEAITKYKIDQITKQQKIKKIK